MCCVHSLIQFLEHLSINKRTCSVRCCSITTYISVQHLQFVWGDRGNDGIAAYSARVSWMPWDMSKDKECSNNPYAENDVVGIIQMFMIFVSPAEF